MSCPVRIHPLKRPEGHQPPVPRWQLKFGADITHVHTLYIGVQRHDEEASTIAAAYQTYEAVRTTIDKKSEDGLPTVEEFDLVDGNDAASAHIWVCYWTDETSHKAFREAFSLSDIHDGLPPAGKDSVGLWSEGFVIPVSRIETNYSGLDYLPGLGRLPNTHTEEHILTAYWGAARDRIPDAAIDLFPSTTTSSIPENPPNGLGKRLVGSNSDNLVHIRTGQFWHNCPEDEIESYERKLEPTLLAGLRYLWENPIDSGARGLRYLRNSDGTKQSDRKETCATGFFTSLDKLEDWAKTHKSHLAIYNGAMRHAKVFGLDRKLRTWHEVVVLKKGEGRFEYVNCIEGTGMTRFTPLDTVA